MTNAYAAQFQVQQYVEHASQYEPMPEGEFDTAEAAIAGMRELVSNCGFSDLRVVDLETGEVLADTDD